MSSIVVAVEVIEVGVVEVGAIPTVVILVVLRLSGMQLQFNYLEGKVSELSGFDTSSG